MPERLRCAVIGTGAIGLVHLKSLATCPQAAVVAISESDAKRCKDAVDQFRISRTYRDYRELLEQPDIDAVTIALPNHLHAPVGIQALQARKHVLIEKPMAMNTKEALKLAETSKKMKRVLMVGLNFRFNRHAQLAKEAVQRGDLGEVYHMRGFWHRRAGIPRIGSWFTRKELAGGGCMSDIGVHMLDLCLHLVGDFDARAVSAQTFAKLGPAGIGEFDWGKGEIDPAHPFTVEDYGVALVKMRSGRSVVLESSWAAYHGTQARERGVDLFGTSGGLTLFPAQLFRDTPGGYQMTELAGTKLPYPEDRIHHWVQSILAGKKPMIGLDEALKVQQILDAIYQSAATGREVLLKPH